MKQRAITSFFGASAKKAKPPTPAKQQPSSQAKPGSQSSASQLSSQGKASQKSTPAKTPSRKPASQRKPDKVADEGLDDASTPKDIKADTFGKGQANGQDETPTTSSSGPVIQTQRGRRVQKRVQYSQKSSLATKRRKLRRVADSDSSDDEDMLDAEHDEDDMSDAGRFDPQDEESDFDPGAASADESDDDDSDVSFDGADPAAELADGPLNSDSEDASEDDDAVPTKGRKKTKRGETSKTPPKTPRVQAGESDVPMTPVDSAKLDKLSSFTRTPSKGSQPSPASAKTPNGTATDQVSPATPASASRTSQPSSAPRRLSSTAAKNKEDDRFAFLVDVRDKNKRRPSDPDYDPTTLYIPSMWWSKFTPFEKQYWKIKQDMWDTILFFKKGKFYEIYERDADIGNEEFQLKKSDRVNMRMAGVPEATFVEWASRFLALGYKVAKVDERENAIAKQIRERNQGSGKPKSKIIERSLSAVLTRGTLMGDFVIGDMSNYIMSIKEDPERRKYGICFADTGTAEFNLSDFEDDAARTTFETLIIQTMPKEYIFESNTLSKETMNIIKTVTASALFNSLDAETFWDHSKSVDRIEASSYFFKSKDDDTAADSTSSHEAWPEVLRASADKEDSLAFSAFGGLVSYLRSLLIDENLVSQGNFLSYDPLHQGNSLLLDGQTLQNLGVLANDADGSTKGTLMDLLCHCNTAFGKRLFRRWLCHPLRKVTDILERQQAVDDLCSAGMLREDLAALLKSLPDIERLMARVQVGNCRVVDFVSLLDALDEVHSFITDHIAAAGSLSAKRLRLLLTSGGLMPDTSEPLEYFAKAFKRSEAAKSGQIKPAKGALPEYDSAQQTMKTVSNSLDKLLAKYRQKIDAKVTYWQPHAGREKYQIQVPVSAKSKVPSTWRLMSSTKNVQRYWSEEVKELVQEFVEAEEIESQVLKSFYKSVLDNFNGYNPLFSKVTGCLAELDCLLSLAHARDNMGYPMCKPEFVDVSDDQTPVFDVRELRHPCLVETGAVRDYIPNDTVLGGDHPGAIILTGPNMGGKSTLLRQTCIAVIMAQLGCWVPAQSFRLSPVDRIFTRIGANDNIMAGRSTFMVELKETANILNRASKHSLVILDELGRGTSTFDGYAIAHAVFERLVEHIKCRTMFATHYHLLTTEFADHARVANYNMSCVVEPGKRDVTFLYKLEPGVCSKSYGMNVASMANLPEEIVSKAEQKAQQFESCSQFGKIQSRVRAMEAHTSLFTSLSKLCEQDTMDSSQLTALLRQSESIQHSSS